MGMPEFEPGTAVEVLYPRSKAEEHGDRAAWHWLPGCIEEICGPDEWLVCVTSRQVATEEDGTPALPGTPDDDLYFPMCFRDASEIRAAS